MGHYHFDNVLFCAFFIFLPLINCINYCKKVMFLIDDGDIILWYYVREGESVPFLHFNYSRGQTDE